MARVFDDGASASYDSTNHKFVTNAFGYTNSVTSAKNARGAFALTDFASDTNFAQKIDNSVAGQMRDCAECHVGGGMMEYVSNNIATADYSAGVNYNAGNRTSLRNYDFGVMKTAFNYFIDIFNPTPANKGAVVLNDYAVTGVLEMDCLICHQTGYDWAARKDAVREGKFDASRALGAGLASSASDGVTVVYNDKVTADATSGELQVDLSASLNAKPQSQQCNSCHQGTVENKYQVEWKKRGEMWNTTDADGTIISTDVHSSIGCMGCHERMTDADYGVSGTNTDAKLGLCDPAKGGASPFEALWNQLDGKQFKNCVGCHEPTTVAGAQAPTFSTYGAPDSQSAHTRAGLTAKIAFDKAGNKISHIQLIDCTACHVKKGNYSGGGFVDGTGADEEGRLAVHDTETVAKPNMANGTAYKWGADGKIHSANLLTSFFWRDMNGMTGPNGGLDVNNDGRTAGMDPFLPTHINNINIMTGKHALTETTVDGVHQVNKDTIAAQKGAIVANIRAMAGLLGDQTTKPLIPKLSFLMVPFKTPHNIAAAKNAFGVNGCADCHGVDKGFYNGEYPINGNLEGKFTFDSDQVAIYTKVNGLVDPTDSHPNVVNKKATRSVPIQVLTKFDTAYATTVTPLQSLRNIDRSEVLYETTFQTRDMTWYDENTPLVGGAIPDACKATSPFYCETVKAGTEADNIGAAFKKVATSTLGWTMKVEVTADNGTTISTRTVQVMNDKVASIADILAAFTASSPTFNNNDDFTVGAEGSALKFTAKAGKKIRISHQADVGPFGLKGKLWIADPITRTNAAGETLTFNTRDEYVTYLNGRTKENSGLTTAAPAVINTVGGAAVPADQRVAVPMLKGEAKPVVAAAIPAGATYKWEAPAGAIFSAPTAATTDVTFTKAGLWRITLAVTNVDGKITKTTQRIAVTEPVLIDVAGLDANGILLNNAASTTVTASATPAHDKYRFVWGDGTTSTIVASAAGAAPVHVYRLLDKYKTVVGANNVYKFNTSIQLFSGTSVVSTRTVKVQITVPTP